MYREKLNERKEKLEQIKIRFLFDFSESCQRPGSSSNLDGQRVHVVLVLR